MNLYQKFQGIIQQYGRNYLLIREGNMVKCSCWDEKRQEAQRDCPSCFGLGSVPLIEKHRARHQDTSVPETLAMLGQVGNFGEMMVPGRFYYMDRTTQVKQGDLVLEVDWTPHGVPIYNDGGLYEISHVTPFYFDNEEMIYKKVYVKDQPILKNIRAVRIVEKPFEIGYELLYGK